MSATNIAVNCWLLLVAFCCAKYSPFHICWYSFQPWTQMPAELQAEAFSLKAWEWRRLQTSKFSPRELAAEHWTSQSKDQVSQTALSSLQHFSLLLLHFWNYRSEELHSDRHMTKHQTKCIKCLFNLIRIHIYLLILSWSRGASESARCRKWCVWMWILPPEAWQIHSQHHLGRPAHPTQVESYCCLQIFINNAHSLLR